MDANKSMPAVGYALVVLGLVAAIFYTWAIIVAQIAELIFP